MAWTEGHQRSSAQVEGNRRAVFDDAGMRAHGAASGSRRRVETPLREAGYCVTRAVVASTLYSAASLRGAAIPQRLVLIWW
jgi:hypothetical protein